LDKAEQFHCNQGLRHISHLPVLHCGIDV
jgi:hypothetical protein